MGNLNGTGTNSGRPIIDPPVIDGGSSKVFAFIGCALGSSGTCGNGTTLAYVFQGTTTLATGSANRVWTSVGTSSSIDNVHIGAFDNTYYAGSYLSGHLYVCGQPNTGANPILYQIGFNASGVMSSSASSTTRALGTSGVECSPLTEFYNTRTATDWLFLSVADGCNATNGGNAGCAQNWNITGGIPLAASAGAAESTGTSAIIIDNVSSAGQASSLYFGTLSGGANSAIKLTQSNLQ